MGTKKQKGFSAILVVVILGSVALGLAVWIATSSLWSIKSSSDNVLSAQARALVNACGEIALEVMRENTVYTGSGTVNLDGDLCTYVVTNTGGNNRSITISGSVGAITRKLEIITTGFNPLTIGSWQEVP